MNAKHGMSANGTGSRWIMGAGDMVLISIGLVTAMALLSGCGQKRSTSTQSVAESSPPPVATQPAALTGESSGAAQAALASGNADLGGNPEILPPELAIGEMDTLVAPGQPIEVVVYGTPDVTEMSLWDGLGDRQALYHDSNGDVWRGHYRVPLRSKQERIGLSVTAKNDANRWRRVWVFLSVRSPNTAINVEPTPAAEPDSAGR